MGLTFMAISLVLKISIKVLVLPYYAHLTTHIIEKAQPTDLNLMPS